MSKNSLFLVFLLFVGTLQWELDELFDTNDVENRACQNGCEAEKVRWADSRRTFKELFRCTECSKLFELCIEYRTCQKNCVPYMPIIPYNQAREFAQRVHAPMNPCLELITACNYESLDAFQILRTENPFLFT